MRKIILKFVLIIQTVSSNKIFLPNFERKNENCEKEFLEGASGCEVKIILNHFFFLTLTLAEKTLYFILVCLIFKMSSTLNSGLKLLLIFLCMIINICQYGEVRHHKKILENFRKFISQELQIRIQVFLSVARLFRKL